MRNNFYGLIIFITINMIIFNGCSAKNDVKPIPYQPVQKILKPKSKAYTFNYIPIIGTQTPDDKVIVDMGVVLRIWMNSYKNRANNLISSHDVYVWAKRPDFIVGNPLPMKNRGILSPSHKMPFIVSDKTVDRSDFKDNKNIRNFVNALYKRRKESENVVEKHISESFKFDATIKRFLENQTKGKNHAK